MPRGLLSNLICWPIHFLPLFNKSSFKDKHSTLVFHVTGKSYCFICSVNSDSLSSIHEDFAPFSYVVPTGRPSDTLKPAEWVVPTGRPSEASNPASQVVPTGRPVDASNPASRVVPTGRMASDQ